MNLTRREKRFLAAALILAFVFLFIPQYLINDWEIVILFVVVGPLGFYIATDPERIKHNQVQEDNNDHRSNQSS